MLKFPWVRKAFGNFSKSKKYNFPNDFLPNDKNAFRKIQLHALLGSIALNSESLPF